MGKLWDKQGHDLAFWRERCSALEEEIMYLRRDLAYRRSEQVRQEHLSAARDTLLKRLNTAYQSLIDEKNILTRELHLTNSKLQAIMDNAPLPIFSMAPDGRILFTNPAFRNCIQHDAIPSPFTIQAVLPKEIATNILEYRGIVLSQGVPISFESSCEFRGAFCIMELTLFPLKNFGEIPVALCCICQDLTENRRMLAENIRSGQLASLGEVAASVAHEINNPINGIINYSQILLDQDMDGADSILDNIIRESTRIASITKSMLNYARSDADDREECSLNAIIENALELTRLGIMKSGIVLKVDIHPELPRIEASPGQIQQVIINLLTNSRKAVLASDREDKQIAIRVPAPDGDKLLRIEVEDNGVGIPREQLSKIFEPFFSSFSSGTGLGLAISKRILLSHHGLLRVESEEGIMTRFVLELPYCSE